MADKKPMVGVLVFPGTNCEKETVAAIEACGGAAETVWHTETDLGKYDGIIVAGGFSYGDYLRAGGIARSSPIMDAVAQFADKGGLVLGICNGFQILTETGLLPGALLTNDHLKFNHKWQRLKMQSHPIWWRGDAAEVRFPIAHHQGCYYVNPEALAEVEAQAIVHYAEGTDARATTEVGNPNGSLQSIAGVSNKEGNVLGMMPHPERAMRGAGAGLSEDDGRLLFQSMVDSLKERMQ